MPPRSRATRHQDATTRGRGPANDLDPMDGLPVQKWSHQRVQINQDASADQQSANTMSTNSVEWTAQFDTPQYPWKEKALPSWYGQVPQHNQEMIRRARTGNTNAKLPSWDQKNSCWVSHDEARKKATALKSFHLNNLDASLTDTKMRNGDDAESSKSNEDSGAEDSSNESNKSADEDEDDETTPFKSAATRKRKLASHLHGHDDARIIETAKWIQLPANVADGATETSFLAPRRPGMPPLYQPEYAQKLFGQYHSSSALGSATGYDLGEGGGLNNASGVLAAGSGADPATAGVATPPRKNIPPRRKKKKLGGPGRRKANPNPEPVAQAAGQAGQGAAQTSAAVTAEQSAEGQIDGAMEGVGSTNQAAEGEVGDVADKNEDDNESGSEAEGSEEGEIDETGGAEKNPDVPVLELETEDTPTAIVPASTDENRSTTNTMDIIAITNDETPTPAAEPIEQVEPTQTVDSIPRPDKTMPEAFIPGLDLQQPAADAEEKEIIDENARAITGGDEDQAAVKGLSEKLTEAAQPREAEAAGSVEEEEVDLLGAMDAAIDKDMSGA